MKTENEYIKEMENILKGFDPEEEHSEFDELLEEIIKNELGYKIFWKRYLELQEERPGIRFWYA